MITTEEYFKTLHKLVAINGQLEEVKRFESILRQHGLYEIRINQLWAEKDRLMKKLDKEHTPLDLAPIAQYIELDVVVK